MKRADVVQRTFSCPRCVLSATGWAPASLALTRTLSLTSLAATTTALLSHHQPLHRWLEPSSRPFFSTDIVERDNHHHHRCRRSQACPLHTTAASFIQLRPFGSPTVPGSNSTLDRAFRDSPATAAATRCLLIPQTTTARTTLRLSME